MATKSSLILLVNKIRCKLTYDAKKAPRALLCKVNPINN